MPYGKPLEPERIARRHDCVTYRGARLARGVAEHGQAVVPLQRRLPEFDVWSAEKIPERVQPHEQAGAAPYGEQGGQVAFDCRLQGARVAMVEAVGVRHVVAVARRPMVAGARAGRPFL